MKIGRLVVGLCLALGVVVIAQQALTNESIEMMARARLGDDVIVSFIQNLGPLVAGLCLALSAVAVAHEASTNKSTERVARTRLSDDVIVSPIQNRAGRYDMTPDTLINLKRKGVSEFLHEGSLDAS